MSEIPFGKSLKNVAVKVIARVDALKQKQGQVGIIDLTSSEKTWLAVQTLGKCWFVAICCIFIPGLHLVLVPTGIIVGIFLARKQLELEANLVTGNLKCPVCDKEFEAEAVPFSWPKRETCPHCQTVLVLKPLV